MTSFFDLKTVLAEQNTYVQRKYTADENAQAAMEQRELQNAENAVEAQEGFLSLTLQQKIQDLLIPGRVLEEFSDVAVNTLMGAINPFLEWLEENEIYYTENMFEDAIRADAMQMYQTKWALTNEAAQGDVGQNFSYSM